MRISDWSSDVCSSDLSLFAQEPCRYRATSSCAPDSREWRRVVAARDRRTVHIRPKDARSSFSRPQKPIHDAVEVRPIQKKSIMAEGTGSFDKARLRTRCIESVNDVRSEERV